MDRPGATALGIWCGVFAVVAALIVLGNERTVTEAYENGARRWSAGDDLYRDDDKAGEGFIYLPQAAMLFVPLTWLPYVAREVVWRVATWGAFGLGTWRLAGLAGGGEERSRRLLTVTLFAVPLSFSALQNGQATLLMAGLTMLAAADLGEQRWKRAAVWLSAGLAVKPLVVVFSLLAGALYRPVRIPLLAGTVVVAALPFACASPGYVVAQYGECVAMFGDAMDVSVQKHWAQLFGMLRVGGLEIPRGAQTLLRTGFAVLTLGLCWWVRRNRPEAEAAGWLYVIGTCYLMLFNPRTENNTYGALGPALGFVAVLETARRGRLVPLPVLAGLAGAMLGSYEIGKFFVASSERAVWLAPLACVVFTVLVVLVVRELVHESPKPRGFLR